MDGLPSLENSTELLHPLGVIVLAEPCQLIFLTPTPILSPKEDIDNA